MIDRTTGQPHEDGFPADPALGAWYTDEEIEAAMDAIKESVDWRVGFRAKDREIAFEDAFAGYTGASYAVAYNGAGSALDMVLHCLNLQPGDEVVSCGINFVGTHVSVLGQGGSLVLCEPDPRTLNLDPADLERVITPRTRAVLATHMNGLSADMDALLDVTARHPHPEYGPPLIVGDAARACGATYQGRQVGSQGWATVFSFQSKKLMTTLGEGGMVTTDDENLARRLRRLRAFGKNQHWGTNCKMSKTQAAVGLVQLRRLDAMNDRRIEVARERTRLLSDVRGLILPTEPDGYRHVYYRYSLLVDKAHRGAGRDALRQILQKEYGIGTIVADPPTYVTHPMVRQATEGQHRPLTDEVADRLVCPSFHPLMTSDDNRYIAGAIAEAMSRIV
ncbi:DegT/DnrJ/EryC1/StrS family aminotransferase [Streptomyces tendae]|uniref:DegT/DnrJ/EryC1/StrS family aminotransferase n=1 Tax=Streptomyces tendae TaxID=1932 RepID=UPI0033E52B16